MTALFYRLLCAVGLHDVHFAGWFRELLGGRLYIVDWERCDRCGHVAVKATREEEDEP